MDNLILGITIVMALVLLGIVAFGAGVEFVASNGIGLGGWGAIRLGGVSEGCCGAAEGIAVGRGAFKTVGVWDTGAGQTGLGSYSTTITGYQEKKYHGDDMSEHMTARGMPREIEASGSAGVWDTGGGIIGLGSEQSTITGYQEAEYHGRAEFGSI